MKTTLKSVFVLAVLCIVSAFSYSQSADEIIAKHIKAHGGMEAWNKVQSMKITGYFTAFSERNPMTEIKATDGKYFADLILGQHKVKEGCDGKIYWTINPWFDLPFARKMNENEIMVTRQNAEFFTPFFKYQNRGFTAKYEGKETIEGIETFKLLLTRENGLKETWFLRTDNYLEYMSKSGWGDFATPVDQEAVFDDFRKVGDVIIPFYIERIFDIRNTVYEIGKVELNIAPEPSVFEIPLSAPIQKLNFMAGTWNVVVDVLNRAGAWTNADSTISVIGFITGKNILRETIAYTRYFPVEKYLTWTYNTESKNYRLSVFDDIYSNTALFQGNFQGDSLVVDNTGISFSKEPTTAPLSRYIFCKISESGFLLEIAGSRDNGANWKVNQRFTYSRKVE